MRLFEDEEAAECKMLEAIKREEFSENEKTANDLRCGSKGDCFFYSMRGTSLIAE